ncbi:hypothetical protein MTP99_009139 [Tenebrio molitor]|nr:hypothetical protein MTP99_009139 [Tenebrio molitor]
MTEAPVSNISVMSFSRSRICGGKRNLIMRECTAYVNGCSSSRTLGTVAAIRFITPNFGVRNPGVGFAYQQSFEFVIVCENLQLVAVVWQTACIMKCDLQPATSLSSLVLAFNNQRGEWGGERALFQEFFLSCSRTGSRSEFP